MNVKPKEQESQPLTDEERAAWVEKILTADFLTHRAEHKLSVHRDRKRQVLLEAVAAGWSLTELGELLGISRQRLSKWLDRPIRGPRPITLPRPLHVVDHVVDAAPVELAPEPMGMCRTCHHDAYGHNPEYGCVECPCMEGA